MQTELQENTLGLNTNLNISIFPASKLLVATTDCTALTIVGSNTTSLSHVAKLWP
jgi:hypothetical protein